MSGLPSSSLMMIRRTLPSWTNSLILDTSSSPLNRYSSVWGFGVLILFPASAHLAQHHQHRAPGGDTGNREFGNVHDWLDLYTVRPYDDRGDRPRVGPASAAHTSAPCHLDLARRA